MGSSHSSPDSSSLKSNADLQKDLVIKCEEISTQKGSQLWKGLYQALQKVSFSNEALESLLSLVELSQKDHESLLLVESLIFETMPSNHCVQDHVSQPDTSIARVNDEHSINKETERSGQSHDNFADLCGDSQFIIVNANDEAEEKEKTKWIERRKSDIRRKNGKLMPPLSQSSPRTCHASPRVGLVV